MKKIYFVSVQYTAEIVADESHDAIRDANLNLRYGVEDPRYLKLCIVGARKVETPQAEAVPVVQTPEAPDPLPEIPEAAVSAANDIPF